MAEAPEAEGKIKPAPPPSEESKEIESSPDTSQERIRSYIGRQDIKGIYSGIEASLKALEKANGALDFIAKPEVQDLIKKHLPVVASKFSNLAKFASLLGPDGVAVSLVSGIVNALLGLVGIFHEDPVMRRLNQIVEQVEALRNEVKEGFAQVKTKIDVNLALNQFLAVHNKIHAKVIVYEQNLPLAKHDPEIFYEHLSDLVDSYPPVEIIHDLKVLHTIISGSGHFGLPLFQQLAKAKDEHEGEDFELFITNLFSQFQMVIALQIRAITMLRVFLALTERDPVYCRDLQVIIQDIAFQRQECDPVAIFEWYIKLKLYGGKFTIQPVLGPPKFLYLDSYFYLKEGERGPPGHFKLKPLKEGAFLISTEKSHGKYMQMTKDSNNGDIKTTTDLNDTSCHWLLDTKKMDDKVFKLRNVKWPHRYAYVKDDYIAAAPYDLSDDHKAQFKLIPFDWEE